MIDLSARMKNGILHLTPIEVPPVVLSNSVLKAWRRCKREYHYKFDLGLAPKIRAVPLYRGIIIHDILDRIKRGQPYEDIYEKAQKVLDEMFLEEVEEVEEYDNFLEDIREVIDGYLEHWEEDGLVYQYSELQLHVELIPGKVVFTARLDGLVEDTNNGGLWIVDHKSHKKGFPNEVERYANQQILIYKWMLRESGYPEVDGVLWDYIRTKPPSDPKVLKSGELSRAKRTLGGTSRGKFLRALKDNNLNPDDYEEELQFLEFNSDKYYKRIYLPISDEMVKNMMEDTVETCMEIYHLQGKTKARNLNKMGCNMCSYKTLCHSELSGTDTEFLIKANFRQREKTMSTDYYKKGNYG